MLIFSGEYLFTKAQWLSSGQISYLFATMAKQKKEGTLDTNITLDAAVVEEEEEDENLRGYITTVQGIQNELNTPVSANDLASMDHPKLVCFYLSRHSNFKLQQHYC